MEKMTNTKEYGVMKKMINKKTLAMCVATAALFILPLSASAQVDKLVVKDAVGVTKFVVKDNGLVGIGTDVPEATLTVSSDTIQTDRGIVNEQHFSHAASAVSTFKRSRGSQAVPEAVINGDYQGAFLFKNYSGTSYLRTAAFGAITNGTPTATTVPTDMFFCSQETDSGNCYGQGFVRLLLSSNGNIGIGHVLNPAHPIDTHTGAYLSAGGVWTDASSRDLKENIEELSVEEAFQTLGGLSPVKFNYKSDAEENQVGFIAEDVPETVATKDRKGMSPMDVTAVLTKVVQEQNKAIELLQKKIEMLENKI